MGNRHINRRDALTRGVAAAGGTTIALALAYPALAAASDGDGCATNLWREYCAARSAWGDASCRREEAEAAAEEQTPEWDGAISVISSKQRSGHYLYRAMTNPLPPHPDEPVPHNMMFVAADLHPDKACEPARSAIVAQCNQEAREHRRVIEKRLGVPALKRVQEAALQRLNDAEAAILQISSGSLESILVKLALWREMHVDLNGELEPSEDATDTAVHGAYEDLMKLTGLDPIAESAMVS